MFFKSSGVSDLTVAKGAYITTTMPICNLVETNQYEVVLQKGESITLDCEYYPQNHTDFLRLPIGNKNLLNEIDKTLTITAKQVADFNVINGANCNNEVVVLLKVTVE